jgi:hypothetical protein
MNDDQFTQLFKSIRNIDARLDNMVDNMATKDDINEVYNRLDGIAARLDDETIPNVWHYRRKSIVTRNGFTS